MAKADSFLLPEAKPGADTALELIRAKLEQIRFGAIALSIHEGRVVQIEVTEKTRLA